VQEQFHVATSRDDVIYVIGKQRIQNELLASCLEQEIGLKCLVKEDIRFFRLPDDSNAAGQRRLLLWDCHEKEPYDLLSHLRTHFGVHKGSQDCVVLFNLPNRLGVEEKFVWQGVRGFFYNHDSLSHFIKGVRGILQGQLWLSRQIMTRCIVEKKGHDNPFKKEDPILTQREIEILAQVAVGRTNQELADRLCISTHTVKTHLYNIYKKINVSNRLQAALWAAKNL
jgi:LuxR family transcriptional regulator of csgAB operon